MNKLGSFYTTNNYSTCCNYGTFSIDLYNGHIKSKKHIKFLMQLEKK